jgi:hypothetical protein
MVQCTVQCTQSAVYSEYTVLWYYECNVLEYKYKYLSPATESRDIRKFYY